LLLLSCAVINIHFELIRIIITTDNYNDGVGYACRLTATVSSLSWFVGCVSPLYDKEKNTFQSSCWFLCPPSEWSETGGHTVFA